MGNSKATLLVDARTGRRWLHLPDKPDADTLATLKATGWRWSGYRKAWNNPSHRAQVPPGVEYEDGGECHYSDERSERLEERAGKLASKSDAAMSAARARADAIPMGQPILVGHHSESRHRRDVERMQRGMRTGVELASKAERVQQQAEGSRRAQARADNPRVRARRIAKLEADERALARNIERYGASEYLTGRLAEVREKLEKERKAQTEAGPLPCEVVEVRPGDLVRIQGVGRVRVRCVNAKTYSGTVEGGGAHGWEGKWGKERLLEVLERGAS